MTTHTVKVTFYGQAVRLTVLVKNAPAIKYGVVGIQAMVQIVAGLEEEHGEALNANWGAITKALGYDPRPIR